MGSDRLQIGALMLLAICSCCSNVIFLELMIRYGCSMASVWPFPDHRVIVFILILYSNQENIPPVITWSHSSSFFSSQSVRTIHLVCDPKCPSSITGKIKSIFLFWFVFWQKTFSSCRDYLHLVILFFLVTLAGNYALGFNIPMPLHMIFKSVRNYLKPDFANEFSWRICFSGFLDGQHDS